MTHPIDTNRRGFLGAAAAVLAAAGFGVGCGGAPSLPGVSLSSEGNLPSLDGAVQWLNSAPLTPAGLRGKVVLVNIWTYTCINWLRQLPYVRGWADTYRDKGLVVIGVHTPEFSFEHNVDNVQLAVQNMRLAYPVAIDNDYAVWDAFANHYWPALYFVDAMGRIRHHAFGEGGYEESERVIQQLLTEAGATDLPSDLVIPDARGPEVPADWDDLKSPENYLGSGRGTGQVSSSSAQSKLKLNQWMLTGNWTVESEAIRLQEPNGRLAYQFHARDLHLVMGPTTPGTSIPFRVLLDGLPPGSAHGFDVDEQGNGTLDQQRLYQLIRQPLPVDDRKFEVEFAGAGASAYAFTFG